MAQAQSIYNIARNIHKIILRRRDGCPAANVMAQEKYRTGEYCGVVVDF
jgi:hypothetical protein